VVSGHYKYWNTPIGDPPQRCHGHINQGGRYPATVEKVASMDDAVHLSPYGRLKGLFEILKEVGAPTPSIDTGLEGKIESKVRIRQEENGDYSHRNAFARLFSFRMTTGLSRR
jgi:hypothetical protein